MLFLWSESRPHTGEAAALDAVIGWPVVLGEAPKALPAPARTVDAETVRRLAKGMTPLKGGNAISDAIDYPRFRTFTGAAPLKVHHHLGHHWHDHDSAPSRVRPH